MNTLDTFQTEIANTINHPMFGWVMLGIFVVSAIVVGGMIAYVLYEQRQADKERGQ